MDVHTVVIFDMCYCPYVGEFISNLKNDKKYISGWSVLEILQVWT